MNVSDKIAPEDKTRFNSLSLEIQVLKNLQAEREAALNHLTREVLMSLTPNPAHYVLKGNPQTDEWELQLKPDALVVPGIGNRADRRLLLKGN